MSSRMDKYYEEASEVVGSRMKKNQTLYRDITHDDLENVNISSNAHVIGDNEANIDIEKIRELLEKKYRKEPKKNRIYEKIEDDVVTRNEEEETKEYDINAILEKAKMDKDVDYERERLKKIRDTQYDILKGLDLEDNKESKTVNDKEENLMNLINTITEKEMNRELNPLDILSDLKGNDNTVVLDGIKEEPKINAIDKQEIKKAVKEEVKKEMDKTFYTNSLSFTKSDFDDFNDLKEDIESNKLLIRILLVIVAIALLIGIFFLINHIFHLNWF